MSNSQLAQEGVLSNPTSHVEYLTFVLHDKMDSSKIKTALSKISMVDKSIRQKDDTANLTITTGFSASAWPILFPNAPMPEGLHKFKELKNGPRHFPSTPGDIFFMIKSSRLDLNYQAAKYLYKTLSSIATLTEDIQGYKYLDDRDLIDFVDGTENPINDERAAAVLISEGTYKGGSFLIVQKYIDRQDLWDAQTTEEQEHAIGRSKVDDIEFDDDKKKPYAHNVKSKVHIDGIEQKMYRQNRAFGNALEHGTMFVGFANTPTVIETSLEQMITADAHGHYDKLLDFVDAKTGANYFIPPQPFMNLLAS